MDKKEITVELVIYLKLICSPFTIQDSFRKGGICSATSNKSV
jgi:hypothetical protein